MVHSPGEATRNVGKEMASMRRLSTQKRSRWKPSKRRPQRRRPLLHLLVQQPGQVRQVEPQAQPEPQEQLPWRPWRKKLGRPLRQRQAIPYVNQRKSQCISHCIMVALLIQCACIIIHSYLFRCKVLHVRTHEIPRLHPMHCTDLLIYK